MLDFGQFLTTLSCDTDRCINHSLEILHCTVYKMYSPKLYCCLSSTNSWIPSPVPYLLNPNSTFLFSAVFQCGSAVQCSAVQCSAVQWSVPSAQAVFLQTLGGDRRTHTLQCSSKKALHTLHCRLHKRYCRTALQYSTVQYATVGLQYSITLYCSKRYTVLQSVSTIYSTHCTEVTILVI